MGPARRPGIIHRQPPLTLRGTLIVFAAVAGVSVLALDLIPGIGATNLVMVYLLAVAVVSTVCTPLESALAAAVSVLAFNFCFVPPRWTFHVYDTPYLVTFAVMLIVALVISILTQSIRRQAREAEEKEKRIDSLYRLSGILARTRSKTELARSALAEIHEVFGGDATVLLRSGADLVPLVPSQSGFEDLSQAALALRKPEMEREFQKDVFYLPLKGAADPIGVLGFRVAPGIDWGEEQAKLLETYTFTLGTALERAILAKESNDARVESEKERVRSTILSSISHDLRTPLTTIAGASSSLIEGIGDPRTLAETIFGESIRLNGEIENLLDMTHLQSGKVQTRPDWFPIEELVSLAIQRAKAAIRPRQLTVDVAPGLPLLWVDGTLAEKAFANLVENAGRHTRPEDAVRVRAFQNSGLVWLEVSDTGPGIAESELAGIFEDKRATGKIGHGLGLSVCRAVADLHGGKVEAENLAGGGAAFRIGFPIPDHQPEVPRG